MCAGGSDDVDHLIDGLGSKGLTGECMCAQVCCCECKKRCCNGCESNTLNTHSFLRTTLYPPPPPTHTHTQNHVSHKHCAHTACNALTGTFNLLAVLSWAVTLASLAGAALPFVEENLLARVSLQGHP
jgi:hypothetical protein